MSDKERYLNALHAMQTGVAHSIERDFKESDPKHLRVGINSALVSNGALVTLLIEKGLITEQEIERKLAEGMEAEVGRYEARLKESFGIDITLL